MFKPRLISSLCVLGLFTFSELQAASVDPTRPPSAKARVAGKAAKPRPLVLQSVRISNQQRRAVISGIKVEEGSRIRGAQVVSIGPGQVLLQQGNNQVRLVMAGKKIKRFKQEQN